MISAIGGITVILAASWCDLRTISQKKRLRATASSLAKRRQPFITILICTHNTRSTIKECLENVVNSSYKQYSIVVVNGASSPIDPKVISAFKKLHPTIPVSIQHIQASTFKPHTLQFVHRITHNSDLVLILDEADIISETTLSNTVTHFIARPDLTILRLRQHVTGDIAIKNIHNHFADLSKNMIDKASLWKLTPRKQPYGHGTMVRSSIVQRGGSTPAASSDYASMTTFSSSHSLTSLTVSLWTIAKILVTNTVILICISMMTYSFYTAATLQSNTLLTLGWTLVSLWLFAITWSDEILGLSKKIALTFAIPFMFFLIYVQLIIALAKNMWYLLLAIPLPQFNLEAIHKAILQEAYSTRF